MPEQIDEIATKTAFWNTPTVNARLRESFGEATGAAALLLADLTPAPDCPPEADEAACRLMLAALKVSAGDLTKLKLWVEVGRMDPRDLIAAAEYSRELSESNDETRREDLAEYVAWASGMLSGEQSDR